MTTSVYPPTGKSKGCPLAVAYGLGVDSTAMLVGMHQRGIRPDLILFADTGGEKPETYAYLPVMQQWLKKVGFPQVQVVKYKPERFKWEYYDTLETNCIVNATLPSLAFGMKGCSLKWKRGPQDKFVDKWKPAQECWAQGGLVTKAIGYDAGPADSKRAWNLKDPNFRWTGLTSDGKKRSGEAEAKTEAEVRELVREKGLEFVSAKKIPPKYSYWYPLRDWGWARDECKKQIKAAGLPLPMKSSCFFCPAMKSDEIDWLVETHPELAMRILKMEAVARPYLGTTQGLWRSVPGGMTPHIHQKLAELVPAYKLVRKKK